MVFNSPYLENEHGDPTFFFAFLAKADVYFTAWQVLKNMKKSVCENILGASVLKLKTSKYRYNCLSRQL